jgi:hypothetical protein
MRVAKPVGAPLLLHGAINSSSSDKLTDLIQALTERLDRHETMHGRQGRGRRPDYQDILQREASTKVTDTPTGETFSAIGVE